MHVSILLTLAVTLHVAPNGNDAWSGRRATPNWFKSDGPFATLERARDAARRQKPPVTVYVRGGVYRRDRTFELAAADSGTTYAAYRNERVRFVGGPAVTNWQPTTNSPVLRADLRAAGITDFDGLELFFQDKPMTVARWPDKGFVRIVDVVEKDGHQIHGIPGSKTGKFIYAGDRPARWVGAKDAWLHGCWFWDWSDQRQKIASIDTNQHIIAVTPPYHGYGYRKGQWYYAYNLLAELNSPGEYYLDRDTGILSFLPPAPIDTSPAVVSVLPAFVTLQHTTNVTLRGFTFEAARATAITLTACARTRIADCTIRNVGGWAVRVVGGVSNSVAGCEIYETGDGGIALDGGDRRTLTPAGHRAGNNHIHDYARWNRMYRPAIALGGVGNVAAHNLIHHAPHEAIAFGGNEHLIEFNEIHRVCQESNDAGAIYSGRDWTARGTMIRYNYLHDITGFENRGCVGVYLDDMLCGITIFGNIFHKVTSAAFIGGGRDCRVENNVFVDCTPAVHVDARALGWAAGSVDATMKPRLQAMPYQESPWRERYPQLLTLLADDPAAPKGNVVARNICVGGKWLNVEQRAEPLVQCADNLLDQDPRFVDSATENFQLKRDSPAFKLGFERIPVERIGLERQ